jgi:hypothetical protein
MKRFFPILLALIAFAAPIAAQATSDSVKTKIPANDTVSSVPVAGIPNKIKIIKKDIDFDASIKVAVGMMAFIAIILTTTQMWNPGD